MTMRFAGLIALFATPLACANGVVEVDPTSDGGADGAGSSVGGDAGAGGSGGEPLCLAEAFGASTRHDLPPAYAPASFEHLGGAGSCGSGELKPRYGTIDLDGDGLADLVVTDDCADASVGSRRWWLHPNTGDAFGAPVAWSLPDYGPDAFEGLVGGGACGGGDLKPRYGLTDMNGDGLIDLVVTDNCADAAVGRTRWLVYANTGSGFAGGVEWPLPDYGPDALDALAGNGDCGGGSLRPAYALLDIDGDAQVELVVTDDCFDDAVGATQWIIHDNVGDGFAASADRWSLPDYGPGALEHPSGPGVCTAPILLGYGLADLDADRRPDLVVTNNCTDAAIGTSAWRVHLNEGTGFAAAARIWGLPDYGPEAFLHLAGGGSCGGGDIAPAYGLVDLDGDEGVDLVITDTCQNDGVGDSLWRLHRRDGTTFASSWVDFPLPDYGPRAFEHLAGASPCVGDDFGPSYGLLDLDGEGHLDLIITDRCTDDEIGTSHWRTHRGRCP